MSEGRKIVCHGESVAVRAEWAIYPNGCSGGFALGSPDGQLLCTGDVVEVLLGGCWIEGVVELRKYVGAQFVARADRTVCGLCPAMRVRM